MTLLYNAVSFDRCDENAVFLTLLAKCLIKSPTGKIHRNMQTSRVPAGMACFTEGFLERFQKNPAPLSVLLAHFLHMLVESSCPQHFSQSGLLQRRILYIHLRPDITPFFAQRIRQYNKTNTQCRKQGFAERSDIDDGLCVQRAHGRNRFSAVSEFTVVIVLNDIQPTFPSEPHKLNPPCGRQNAAQRELMRRGCIDRARILGRKQVNDLAPIINRNRLDDASFVAKGLEHATVAWILHDDLPPISAQHFSQHMQRLRRSGCDEDVLRTHG